MNEEKITNWQLSELEKKVDAKGDAMSKILEDGEDASSIISSLIIAKASIDRLMAHCMLIMDEHEQLAMKAMPICIELREKMNPLLGAAYAVSLGENIKQVKHDLKVSIDDMDIEMTDINELTDQLFHGEDED